MVAYILIVIALEPRNPLCEHTNPFITSLIKPSLRSYMLSSGKLPYP